MDQARLTADGRTTIPKAIRTAAGLRDGDVLAFPLRGIGWCFGRCPARTPIFVGCRPR